MLGYSEAANIKPLPGVLKQVILITMRNPQSHPNITTIILYCKMIVLMSIIVT